MMRRRRPSVRDVVREVVREVREVPPPSSPNLSGKTSSLAKYSMTPMNSTISTNSMALLQPSAAFGDAVIGAVAGHHRRS